MEERVVAVLNSDLGRESVAAAPQIWEVLKVTG
jgi:hypothetical protein